MNDYFSLNFITEQLSVLLEWMPDLIGCLGATVILIAYGLLQFKRILADSFTYLFINLIGAILILISLYYAWNIAAVAMEVSWMVISLIGLFKLKRNPV